LDEIREKRQHGDRLAIVILLHIVQVRCISALDPKLKPRSPLFDRVPSFEKLALDPLFDFLPVLITLKSVDNECLYFTPVICESETRERFLGTASSAGDDVEELRDVASPPCLTGQWVIVIQAPIEAWEYVVEFRLLRRLVCCCFWI
jgi:hypothetical protein